MGGGGREVKCRGSFGGEMSGESLGGERGREIDIMIKEKGMCVGGRGGGKETRCTSGKKKERKEEGMRRNLAREKGRLRRREGVREEGREGGCVGEGGTERIFMLVAIFMAIPPPATEY